jgi:hypothetical protein
VRQGRPDGVVITQLLDLVMKKAVIYKQEALVQTWVRSWMIICSVFFFFPFSFWFDVFCFGIHLNLLAAYQ